MDQGNSTNAEWWCEPKDDVHACLFALVDHLRQTCDWQRQADDWHAQMYAGARAGAGLTALGSSVSTLRNLQYKPAYLARNISRSAVDTYTAKVAKHRPMPEILANKGSWRDQRRARKMTQLVDGEFFKHKIFKKWARVIVRDSAVYGRGVLKIDLEREDSKNIRCHRIQPKELWVDDIDAKYGEPRNLYHVTSVDVGVLIKSFAGKDEELARDIEQAAKNDSEVFLSNHAETVRRVRTVETWHLCDDVEAHSAQTPKKHDCNGRHCLAVHGRTLVDEPWEFNRFPFAILNYLEPLEGFFGVGLCEQLEGYQNEQELMSEKVSDGHYYTGGGIIIADNNADLVEEDFTNDTNVRFLTKNPSAQIDYFQPSPVHPQDYQYLRDLAVDALNEVGMNQMTATGTTQSGITSGVALQAVDDIQDERLVSQGYGYAEWCCDVAELFLMWIAHITKSHGDYCAEVPLRNNTFTPLSWKDVKVDGYIIKTQNAALMAMTPAARRQTLNDLFMQGQIDGLTFMRYLDSPDVNAEIDAETSDRILVDEVLDLLMDAEDVDDPNAYRAPNPYAMPLQWAMGRAQKRLAQAELRGCPEENLELIRQWILECQQLLTPPAPPNEPPVDMAATPGMGMGMPAPEPPLPDPMSPMATLPPTAPGIQ